ncbi:MAG: 50S ribosomal protein L11 methyltransferase [Opitutaceae bacterium]|nr:50S ribosomal protein L11 methyltransferase [Opitutaceae bacterium]
MPLFELKSEIALEWVPLVEETLGLLEDGRLMVLEDKPSARAWIAGYFERREEAQEAWQRVLAALDPGISTPIPEVRELADQDWRDSYKAHFHAWKFGRLHWVPIWERDTHVLPPGDAVIWLDPGLAFGTGNHETTRLCCERLATYVEERERSAPLASGPRPERVLDVGCGSGILALSAARLGFQHVEGFDNDPEAVHVSLENAALNGLDGVVPFFAADLVTGLAGREVDLLMANIQADVLMAFARELVGAVAPGGRLVLSGILSIELETVRRAFSARVPTWPVATRTLGEWSDLVLDRPAN